MRLIAKGAGIALIALGSPTLAATPGGEWTAPGGDNSFNRYSPLNIINRSNVGQLKILWARPAVDPSLVAKFPNLEAAGRSDSYFRSTPIVYQGVVYASNGAGLVEAFDAATGRTLWVQQPFSGAISELAGTSARGVAMWRSGARMRIISARGSYLYSLDARTGKPDPSFDAIAGWRNTSRSRIADGSGRSPAYKDARSRGWSRHDDRGSR